MPRPVTQAAYSPWQFELRTKLAQLDPPVDLDALVRDARAAGESWRQVADKVNSLVNEKPPVSHSTLVRWYDTPKSERDSETVTAEPAAS